jgi:hypothetical protein
MAARLLLRRRYREAPLDVLLHGLGSEGAPPRKVGLPLEVLERDVRRVERWLGRAPLLPNTCLYRALGRYAVLTGAGLPAVFFMGVPRRGEGDGHAWVEVFERPFAEPQEPADFAITFRYPMVGKGPQR